MQNLMINFTIEVAYFFHDNWNLILLAYLLLRGILATYLKIAGYDKWWEVLIPFGHYLVKLQLGAVNLWLLVITGILAAIFYIFYDLIFFILYLVFRAVVEFKFAQAVVDNNPYIWAIIPFEKYLWMIKEVLANAGNESG